MGLDQKKAPRDCPKALFVGPSRDDPSPLSTERRQKPLKFDNRRGSCMTQDTSQMGMALDLKATHSIGSMVG